MIVAIEPVVLSLGPLAVRWFGLLALAGLGLAVWLSLRELDRQALSRRAALDALAWGLPAGVLVGRLIHVLGWWDYYLTHASEVWQLNLDGLSVWGGLVGSLLVAAARLKHDPQAVKHDLHGLKHDPQSLKSDAQGLKHDAQGLKSDAQGLKSDAQGLKSDAQGLNYYAHGRKYDPQGPKHDPQGLKPDAQDLRYDPQDPKYEAQRRRRLFDAIAPNLALGIAVGRVGGFLDGHGQGLPSDLPWATQYASRLAATPDFGVPRHPAQLYDALIALVLFFALRSLPHGVPAGARLAGFLVVYGASRLVLGAVRLDPAFLFGLQIEQLLAAGAIAFGVLYALRPLIEAASAEHQPASSRSRTSEDSLAA